MCTIVRITNVNYNWLFEEEVSCQPVVDLRQVTKTEKKLVQKFN